MCLSFAVTLITKQRLPNNAMNKTVAEETSLSLLKASADLNALLARLRDQCSEEEFQRYRRGFGYVLGYMLTEILNPLYAEYPELKPEQLGGTYRMPPSISG